MCGRFTLTTPAEVLALTYNLADVAMELAPRWNIAPTQEVAAVVEDGGRRLRPLRWGLIPGWAKDRKIAHKLINARAETLADKPSFRGALRRRRCLVLADGYYEWRKTPAGKSPVWIRMAGGAPFAMAGLWERWRSPEGEEVRTCTIVTGEPNETLRPIHHRMPVILPAPAQDAWLAPDLPVPEALADLLVPHPGEGMTIQPVSTWVNSPRNEGPACVAPPSE